MKMKFTSDKVEKFLGGWSRSVLVTSADGTAVEYRCFVSRGKRVRIRYKPRGKNIGYKWVGEVYVANGARVYSDIVPGSIGCRGLLEDAGVFVSDADEAQEGDAAA